MQSANIHMQQTGHGNLQHYDGFGWTDKEEEDFA